MLTNTYEDISKWGVCNHLYRLLIDSVLNLIKHQSI